MGGVNRGRFGRLVLTPHLGGLPESPDEEGVAVTQEEERQEDGRGEVDPHVGGAERLVRAKHPHLPVIHLPAACKCNSKNSVGNGEFWKYTKGGCVRAATGRPEAPTGPCAVQNLSTHNSSTQFG